MMKLTLIAVVSLCNVATAQWCNEFGAPTKFMVLEINQTLTVETDNGRFIFAIADTLDRENYKSYQLGNTAKSYAVLWAQFGRFAAAGQF